MLPHSFPPADRYLQTLEAWWIQFLIILFVVAHKCNNALSYPQFWAQTARTFYLRRGTFVDFDGRAL